MSAVLDLLDDLLRRPSLTPEDAGCQHLIGQRLAAAGFTVTHLRFGDTDNLWATHGATGPLFALVGHTDVVPTGPLEAWTSPPFEPTVRDGKLFARGAADMKSGVAAMCCALERFVAERPDHPGTVALMLTSDEEGPAQHGVKQVMEWLATQGLRIDHCLIGEPSSRERLGDQMRNGRRGSLHGYLTVHGIQGHVAYPELARNPVHQSAAAIAELAAHRFDGGNDSFPPSSFQIYEIKSGTGANNVIPGSMTVNFNFRFGTASTPESLEAQVRAILDRHGLDYELRMRLASSPFHTGEGPLLAAVRESVAEVCGYEPVADTGGGTSDGRYIAPTGAAVVELGPVNASIHKIDEWVELHDVGRLQSIYEGVLGRLALAKR